MLVYWLFAVLFIYYELVNFIKAERIIGILNNKKEFSKVLEESLTTAIAFLVWFFCGVLYFMWSFAGLFTSQWKIFLVLIIMGFIPKMKLGVVYMKIDAAISIGLLMFMILNRFHLHLI